MEREPLDSIEYESTYLELRPFREQLTGTDDARLLADVQVDDVVAPYGIAGGYANVAPPHSRTPPAPRLVPAPRPAGRAPAHAVDPPADPPTALRRPNSSESCSRVQSDRLLSRRPLRSSPLLECTLVAVVSASLGVAAEIEPPAARSMFVALTGVLLLGWARLAWRGTPPAEPFNAGVTRSVDRGVTAVGTFFAIALWARYAALGSTSVARTVVLVLCGLGLIRGLLSAAQHLLP